MAQASVEVKSVRASESSSEKKKAQKQSSIYVLLHALPKREKEHSWKQKVWRQQATNHATLYLQRGGANLLCSAVSEGKPHTSCSCMHVSHFCCDFGVDWQP
jgi:hypothetical protein